MSTRFRPGMAFAWASTSASASTWALAGAALLWAFASTFLTLQMIELNLKGNININALY